MVLMLLYAEVPQINETLKQELLQRILQAIAEGELRNGPSPGDV